MELLHEHEFSFEYENSALSLLFLSKIENEQYLCWGDEDDP